jgi:hypothetical protein
MFLEILKRQLNTLRIITSLSRKRFILYHSTESKEQLMRSDDLVTSHK